MGVYFALYLGLIAVQVVLSIILPIMFGVAGAVASTGGQAASNAAGVGGAIGGGLLFLVGMLVFLCIMAVAFGLLVPLLAVTTRRLHDAGLTGWFTLALFVVSGVATIVIGVLETQPGANIYGGYSLPGGASPPPPPQPQTTPTPAPAPQAAPPPPLA